MQRLRYFLIFVLFLLTNCEYSFDIKQHLAGIDAVEFIYEKTKETNNLSILITNKRHRRHFVNSLVLQKTKNKKNFSKKIGKIIFHRKNVKVILLEGVLYANNTNEFYFICQNNQKEYIYKVENIGIELIKDMQQFPEIFNQMP
jgi:hypothetical protein